MISGGQTGVDQAALFTARTLGLDTGGFGPPDLASEAGPIPQALGLKPTPEERSPLAPYVPRSQRTEWNVRWADATLILTPASRPLDPGTALTLQLAKRFNKPVRVVDPAAPGAVEQVRAFLLGRPEAEGLASRAPPRVLNVAGPAESAVPGIFESARALLEQALPSRSS